MGFAKLIERLYMKVFVGMAASHSGIRVVVELVKNGEVKERASRSFEGTDLTEAAAFLAPYLDESPLHYVALLNTMEEQGALPVCTPKEAEAFTDVSTAVTLCPGGGWMVYASKPGVDALQKEYAPVGIDFLFSPFTLLERFFSDKIATGTALYVLVDEDAVSSAVFGDGMLLYARHIGIAKEEEKMELEAEEQGEGVRLSFELDVEGVEEGLELDDINAIDDLEGLDDLHEIEDLDMVEDLENFAEEEELIPPVRVEEEPEEEEVSLEGFDKDYKRFQLIQMALERYYGDPQYDSRFIETVYIADGCGLDDDLKHYLEEELFMKVHVRKIDLAAEAADLAKLEVNDAS
jgi:hypothetical protein